MTIKQRLKKIRAKVWLSKDCPDCAGTGTKTWRKKGTRGSGCAKCAVRSSMVMINTKDYIWLLNRAGL